ncbi:hypothetical protein Ddye_012613 [Dipteronia dyeriana]|uniref:DUF1985 domain-containing protein n=1 Tax=Dipteronia dyeriana TaxID=168575 RepID=A0AAD9X4S8_9ROSI|nr:hypothetical protein Ddye_012613 [Dipteronia dyeriana]
MRNRLRDLLKTPQGDWYDGKLTRHDHFDALAHIDDALNRVPTEFTDEDRRQFMASCFWNFLTMHREMKFSGGVIHRLLLRELHHNGPTNEMQFMLENQSVRFSKVEFFLINGLRFGIVPDTTMYTALENDIHQRYFPEADEVSLEEIMGVVTVREFGEAYDAVKLCLIYMLNWILMGWTRDLRFQFGSFGWLRILMRSTRSLGVSTCTCILFTHSSMRLTGGETGSSDASRKKATTYIRWRPTTYIVYLTPYW